MIPVAVDGLGARARLTTIDTRKSNGAWVMANAAATWLLADTQAFAAVERWHPIELALIDHETYSETGTPNPFLDRRLVVTFTAPSTGCAVPADCAMNAQACIAGSCVYKAEGFFDSDGAGGTSGSTFSVLFAPHLVGQWTADVRFCEGTNVAAAVTAATCGSFVDGTAGLAGCESGSCVKVFDVVESTRAPPDFRAPEKGVIVNDPRANDGAGESYLRFLGGEPGYFVEVGMNVGEGLLGYAGFDNTKTLCTPTRACVATKSYPHHVQHWNDGDPDWQCGVTASSPDQSQDGCTSTTPATAGQGIIGALNYLSDPSYGGVNSKYMLLNSSPNGDTCNVYPFLNGADTAVDRARYDISKLRQWRIVLEHMMTRGLLANLAFGENENDCSFQDSACSCTGPRGACIGSLRKVYLREMVARFGHLPGIRWSVDEENDFTNPARRDFIEHLKALDPYDHPVSVHTKGNAALADAVYVNTVSGVALHHSEPAREPWDADLDVAGYQATFRAYSYDIFAELWGGSSFSRGARVGYRAQSVSDRMRWAVIIDEPQGCDHQLTTGTGNRAMEECREGRFFPGLLSGLAGWEWYLEQTRDGNGDNHDYDPCVEDFAASAGVASALRWSGIARRLFDGRIRDVARLVWSRAEAHLTDGNGTKVWQGANEGVEYVGYQDDNDPLSADLRGAPGDAFFDVIFVDPDLGDTCACSGADCDVDGRVQGGAVRSLGACPCCANDSLVIVRATSVAVATTTTLPAGATTTTSTTQSAPTTLPATTTTFSSPTTTSTSTTSTTLSIGIDAVEIDGSSVRTACGGSASNGLTISNVTVGAQADRILVVSVGGEEDDADCNLAVPGASVTYRGLPLQRAITAVSGTSSWRACNGIFYLLDPPTGTGSVAVTFPATTTGLIDNRHAGALVIYNAAQRAPEITRGVGANTATNPVTPSLTVPTAGSLVIDVVSQGNLGSFVSLGVDQVEYWETSCTSSGSATSARQAPAAEAVFFSWTHTAPNRFASSIAAFAPSTGDGTATTTTTAPSTTTTTTTTTTTSTTTTTTTTLPASPGTVQVDVASIRSACGGGASNSLVIPSMTVGAQANRILLVTVGAEEDDGDCNLAASSVSVTYGGIALQRAVTALSSASGWRACNGIFYLLAPPTGTANVTITFPSTTSGLIDNRHGGAFVVHGAAQAAPEAVRAVGAQASTNPVTTTLTVATAGALAVDVFSQGNLGAFTPLASEQIERWEASCTSSGSASSTRRAASAGSVALTWSHTSPNRFAHAIAAFRPAN